MVLKVSFPQSLMISPLQPLFDKMVNALNILVEKGKEVGYFINFDKTQYLMSPVDNHNELKESNALKIKTDY